MDVGTAASEDPTAAVVSDLELVAARMVASKDNCSDKSLALFSKIAARQFHNGIFRGVQFAKVVLFPQKEAILHSNNVNILDLNT